MTSVNAFAILAARIMIAAMFLVAGIGKLGDVAGFTGYMTSAGVPAILAWPVILLEIAGAAALVAGFQTRIAALALAGFTIMAGALYHLQPADQMQMIMFYKNLAITGGLLMLAVTGAGHYAFDNRRVASAVA
ncbi:DoxX family protein [Defluviimonas sp. WL0002]|uniref:DoxX family protein n=1 Tax=Albidovulum marisflavi TaxID=2984159 RepID=A0ABT2ZFZ5_9RHOB|nr:DoxX family protein [Defluviimonas sp. WL0002]MCV2870062.1 DoxX family protein [Defluviimonas sp. WL0002]